MLEGSDAVKPKVCVLRAPGTNCDVETAFAFETSGAVAERVHWNRILEQPDRLADYQILCVPGGFSFGDDIGAGVIFARQMQHRLGEAIAGFLAQDRLVLGICNGFQVLLKAGLLPDGAAGWDRAEPQQATLTWNRNGKYTALWVRVKVAAPRNVFLHGLDELDLPIAHAEGRVTVTDPAVLSGWRQQEQIAVQYVPRTGVAPPVGESGSDEWPYPINPNGSLANIAGLSDPSGRILGLMPHPERYIHRTQHPTWTRQGPAEPPVMGLRVFQNAVAYFA